jgi:tripartite-type tricarboxylate transporter receptor subunit TctC
MKLHRRRFLHLAMTAAALPGTSSFGWAQAYPSHPITMIVPFAAGGPTDVVARIVAEGMKASLGQTVIIENVAGADGTIGVGRAARAAPDGYTLSAGQLGTHVLNGAVYSLRYDLVKDFEPIALLGSNPYILVTNKTLPAKDLRELIAWAKLNENKASIGVASTTQRLLAFYFQNMTGTKLLMVPYRGAAPALQGVIAGDIAMVFDQPSGSLQQLRAGNTKAYGVTWKTRLAALPEIPTLDEAGLTGFDLTVWNAVWAPRGAPNGVIAKVNAAVAASLADPGVRQRLAEVGQEIPPPSQQTPEALAAYQKAEIEKWWPIVKAAGIKVVE